jgi:L-rhamnose isomerase/sugar isomerase
MISNYFNEQYIFDQNRNYVNDVELRYAELGSKLLKNGIDIDSVLSKVKSFSVALPSWGLSTGGTRFGRFPGISEPKNVLERLQDCVVVNQLTQCTDQISLHFPWDLDLGRDLSELKDIAKMFSVKFGPVNSNTFQNFEDQTESYKFGSLTHTEKKVRDQAIAFNIECIEFGKQIGSTALTLWVGDGSNFPGQQNFSKALSRYLDSAKTIYNALPHDWHLYIEHKMFEPSFYSTVIQDWGTSILCAQILGKKS